jgi:hypothetical protein
MDEMMKNYLKEHLIICIDTKKSWDGEYMVVKLKIDDEEISKDSIPVRYLREE